MWSIFGKVEEVTHFYVKKKWASMAVQFRPKKVGLKDWGLNDWA
jgi:hypothetical protein